MEKVAWVIPSFIEGSGGYRTIFQHVNFMAQKYECDIYVYDSGDFKNAEQLKGKAYKLYGICNCRFYLGFPIRENIAYKLVIATAWITAEIVKQYKGSARKIYFVQDYEPFFYPVGNQYLEASNTYNLGFHHVTIGKWLSWKLSQEHNANVSYFEFCVDKEVYHSLDGVARENAVCFIYQPEKPRRSSELGLQALRIVKQVMPEVTIYLYGTSQSDPWGIDCINRGMISLKECNCLYNSCQVGLCISATNPSRIPFEMLAAGLPVVDIYKENNLFDYPSEGILLAQSRPESIAQAILNILQDIRLRNKMSIEGQQFMEKRTLDFGMKQFMNALDTSSGIESCVDFPIQKSYEKIAVEASHDIIQIGENLLLNHYKKKGLLDKIKRNRWIRKLPGIKRWGKVFGNV